MKISKEIREKLDDITLIYYDEYDDLGGLGNFSIHTIPVNIHSIPVVYYGKTYGEVIKTFLEQYKPNK